MPLRVIFIDLNSYFASVEQAECPELMGKPVAVVPMIADTTSCIAASYPAKAFGVRTGTSVRDARILCPAIKFIKADHRKYVEYHHRISKAIERCFPIWKVFSIDEMAIQLFGRERDPQFAWDKALEIKKRILEDVHPALTCSIGIAPNRYVAKIASDMQKPNGLVVIKSEELPHRLFDLQLRDFPGVGARMEERLIRAGCFSARTLCQMSSLELHNIWGNKLGDDFWRLIRGDELDDDATNEATTKRGSLSHSRVLAPDSRNPESAWSNLVALTSKAAMRLRQEGYYARSLVLHLKFLFRRSSASYWDKQARFHETQDSDIFLKELSGLWKEAPKQHILKIGIVLSALVPADRHQLSLFEDLNKERLMLAVDNLNKLHRKNLVVYGASIELQKVSQAPISFGHIPEKFE